MKEPFLFTKDSYKKDLGVKLGYTNVSIHMDLQVQNIRYTLNI